jgi:perosamine synthetase
MTDRIPLYEVTNVIGTEVLDDVRDVIESGWLTLGEKTEQFERGFADAHDTAHGIAVNSCTSALYAALRALGIGSGDTVVVPAMTFSATANVVRLLGAEVVLADVDDTGNVSPASLERVLAAHDADAIMPVHLYGLPCDMDAILSLADEYDAAVVEDCAHAPGATAGGRPVGSFGDAGCFSFYATKNMTTGEGGMVTTDDDRVAEKVRKLRNHHQTKSPDEKVDAWGYDVDGLGFNFRMSEITAALGVNQLERLPDMNDSRRTVADRYRDAIADIDGLRWVGTDADDKTHSFHLFVVEVEEPYPYTRNELYDHLSERDILTGVHYPSLSKLTYYRDIDGEYERAESLSDRILSLPMFPDMEPATQRRVVEALRV